MPTLESLKSALKAYPPFANLAKVLGEQRALLLKGCPGSLKAFAVASLVEAGRRVIWIITRPQAREDALSDLSLLLPDDQTGLLLGSRDKGDITPFETRVFRARALYGWLADKPFALLGDPACSWMDLFPSPEVLARIRIHLQKGMALGRDDLVRRLAQAGYARSEMAENRGEFALRGGILDVFPYTHDKPLRLEFWGETVDSLRRFEPATQRTVERLTEEDLFLSHVEGEGGGDLTQYLREGDILFAEEPEEIANKAREDGRLQRWEELLQRCQVIYWGSPTLEAVRHELGGTPQQDFGGQIDFLVRSLKENQSKHSHCYIACDNAGQMERLRELLDQHDLPHPPHYFVAHLSSGFHLPPGVPSLYTDHQIFRRQRRRRTYFRMHNFSPIERADMLKKGDYIVHEDYGIGQFLGLNTIEVGGHIRECLQIAYRDKVMLYVRLEALAKVQKFSGREGFIPPLTRIGRGDWEKLRKKANEAVRELAQDLLNLYATRSAQDGFAFPEDGSMQMELESEFEYEETPDQIKAIEDVKRDMEEPKPMDRLVCGDVGYGKTEVALRAAFKAITGGKQVALLVPTTLLAQQHFNTFSKRLALSAIEVEMLSRFRTERQQDEIIKRLRQGRIDIVIGTHRLLSDDVIFSNLGLLIVDEEHRFGVKHKEMLKKLRSQVDVLVLTATPIPRTLHMSLIGARDMSLIRTPPQHRLPIETEISPFSADLIKEAILREVDRGGQVYFVHNRIESILAVKRMLEKWLPQVRFAVAHGQMPESALEKTMSDFLAGTFEVLISTMIIESGLDLPNVNTMIVNRADRFGLAQLYQLRGRIGRSNRQAYAYLLTPPKGVIPDQARKRLEAIRDCSYLGAGFQLALHDLEIRGAGEIFGAKQSGFIHAVGYDLYQKMLEDAVREIRPEHSSSPLERPNGPQVGKATGRPEFEPKIEFPFDAFLPMAYVEQAEQRVELYRRLSNAGDLPGLQRVIEEIADRYGAPPVEAQRLFDLMGMKLSCLTFGLTRLEITENYLVVEIYPVGIADWGQRLRAIVQKLDGLPVEFAGDDPPQMILRWERTDSWDAKIVRTKEFLQRLLP